MVKRMNENEISRVHRSKEEARASYDSMSRVYDLLIAGSERKFRQAGLDLLAVTPGETVLDLGFGSGESTVALARSVGEGGEVHGIDLSAGMLRVAMQKVAASGLAPFANASRSRPV